MADLVTNPHFALPFRFGKGGCLVVEDNSPEEIEQCAEIALRYERGQRTGMPTFGLPDQALLQGGANFSQIVSAVTEHDDRIEAEVTRDQIIQHGVDRVRVTLKARTNG